MSDSAEMAGGTAHGLSMTIVNMGIRELEALEDILMDTGRWTGSAAGMFLGHIKMAIDAGGRGAMTLNLTDLGTGVERHGSISFPADAEVRFMAAVLDVDRQSLEERMESSVKGKGFTVSVKRKGSLIDIE